MNLAEEVLSLFSAKYRFLEELEVSEIRKFESELHTYFKEEHPEILREINEKKILSDELIEEMKVATKKFLELFNQMKGN